MQKIKTQQKRSRGYSEGQRGMQKLKFMYEYANVLQQRNFEYQQSL